MIPNAYVLIADLVSSRDQGDRSELASRIEKYLSALAKSFSDQWIAPLETSRGLDELSGVLRQPDRAFDIAVALNTALWPATFRFALADGAIDIGDSQARASDMDGPAFHTAADALDRARKNKLILAVNLSHASPLALAVVEQTVVLHHTVIRDWGPATARAVQLYRPIDGTQPTQRDIATQLGQTQQAVADAHRRARLRQLSAAEDAVRNYFAANTNQNKH